MRIDVHSHWWPASYIDLMQSLGREDLRFAMRQDDNLDGRIAEMDRVGVDVSLLSAIGLDTEMPTADGAAQASRHINDLYVELTKRYDGRFRGFAQSVLPFVPEAIAEADRALDELGLVGIALPCIIGGKPLDDSAYEEFWKHLGSRKERVVVYVHPVGTHSNAHPGLTEFGLNMLLGSTLQIAEAPLRVALSGLTTRYPNIHFIFAVCGGTLPYLWQRYETNLRRGLDAVKNGGPMAGMFAWLGALDLDAADPMSIFRKNLWFDTSVQDVPYALRLSKETYGADRILLGSDSTFASLTEAVESVQNSADLTADEKHRILDVAAEELMQLR
jgi:predicted TIM-barrel fold metal-dependent hydrolase